jgi:hypothetical protein
MHHLIRTCMSQPLLSCSMVKLNFACIEFSVATIIIMAVMIFYYICTCLLRLSPWSCLPMTWANNITRQTEFSTQPSQRKDWRNRERLRVCDYKVRRSLLSTTDLVGLIFCDLKLRCILRLFSGHGEALSDLQCRGRSSGRTHVDLASQEFSAGIWRSPCHHDCLKL